MSRPHAPQPTNPTIGPVVTPQSWRSQEVGLGLAIVKSISEAYGAVLKAEGQLGGGLTVSVVLPG
jgi:signal transduction histidine kinase